MLNPMDLSGRTVLVTGASSGIGRATCIVLSRLGAKVVLTARDPQRLQETARAMDGGPHEIEQYDLADVDSIPDWLKAISRKTGSLSGVVHSAGLQTTRPLRFLNTGDLEEITRINVTAAVQLARGFRQKGVHSKPASVVFLSSVLGIVGRLGVAAYAASKGALIALAKSLALELAQEEIRVNCLAPGQVRTELTERLRETLTEDQFAAIEAAHPLGLGEADDVAYAAAFLLADTGRWITGSTLVVDGGYTAH